MLNFSDISFGHRYTLGALSSVQEGFVYWVAGSHSKKVVFVALERDIADVASERVSFGVALKTGFADVALERGILTLLWKDAILALSWKHADTI